jgi:hypothetical protein
MDFQALFIDLKDKAELLSKLSRDLSFLSNGHMPQITIDRTDVKESDLCC